jgi:hypothetical protein
LAQGWPSEFGGVDLIVVRLISGLLPLSLVAMIALATGCGGNGSPFKSVPISGKVTYDDGSVIPVAGMKIYFHSLAPAVGDMHPRPGIGSVDADGSFKDITTYKYADGVVVGKNTVTLVCQEGGKLTTKIPKEYEHPQSTPLQVEVTKSGQFLEIKVPKPKVAR